MFMYIQNGLLYSALKITNSIYVSTVKNMETDGGLEIEEELDIVDVVLWQYRGTTRFGNLFLPHVVYKM